MEGIKGWKKMGIKNCDIFFLSGVPSCDKLEDRWEKKFQRIIHFFPFFAVAITIQGIDVASLVFCWAMGNRYEPVSVLSPELNGRFLVLACYLHLIIPSAQIEKVLIKLKSEDLDEEVFIMFYSQFIYFWDERYRSGHNPGF